MGVFGVYKFYEGGILLRRGEFLNIKNNIIKSNLNNLYNVIFYLVEMIDEELRQKGERLLKQGFALGDTSGKIGNLEERNVFALVSKNFEYTILSTSSEKKKIFQKLKKKNKNYSNLRCYQIIHSVEIYLALRNYISSSCPGFYICPEGFAPRWIKYYLMQFLGSLKKINVESLTPMFGKDNIADKVAGDLRGKKGKTPTLTLKESDFKKLNLI